MKEYRIIPGFEKYSVSNDGCIRYTGSEVDLKTYRLDDYPVINLDEDYNSKLMTLHRAVALTWIINPDPTKFTIINHIDGVRWNNNSSNLEWTDYSGNNYHAVNTGLRSDPIAAYVRDVFTGVVTEFPSTAQAVEFMGLRKDAAPEQYYPKKFGALVKGKYEFRYKGDITPWFYVDRPLMIPARYIVLVYDSGGKAVEITSRKALYKKYQLYKSPRTDIPGIVEFARALYPHLTFVLRDSYTEERFDVDRIGEKSFTCPVAARKDGVELQFDSITKCAGHFEVDRSVVLSRLDTDKDFDGWVLIRLPDMVGTSC